jgi:hypothetical protein
MQTTHDLDLAIRDSIAMESAATWRDLEYVCRGIEARHAVEGVSKGALALYEEEKAKNAKRVALRVVA